MWLKPSSLFFLLQASFLGRPFSAQPSNDDCDSAAFLTVNGDPVQGSNTAATLDPQCAGSALTEAGVWYVATGTGNTMTVSTCSANTSFETEIRVKTACPRSNCVNNEDPGFLVPCDFPSVGTTVTWDSDSGQTYYILVSGPTISDVGNFEISLVDYVPPPNDGCAGAVALAIGGDPVAGTSLQATRDSQCAGSSRTERGVWYVATGSGKIMTVSTCSSQTNFAAEIRGKTACPRANCIANEDPGFDVPCSTPFGATLTWSSEAGQQYYFLVSGDDSSDTGSFEISLVDYDPPGNDVCTGAVALTVNGPAVSGSTDAATLDPQCAGSAQTERGVWYIATGTGNVMTVSTCSTAPTFATEIRVKTACPRSNCVADEDPGFLVTCPTPFGAAVTWDSDLGQTYYFLVSGTTSADTGDFDIDLVDYEPPPNDKCDGSITLTVNNAEEQGTTDQSTRDPPCAGSAASERGVWYQVTGTGGEMTVSTCSIVTNFDTRIYVKTSCPRSNCVASATSGVAGCTNPFAAEVSWNSVNGTTYHILVSGSTTANTGDFAVRVTDPSFSSVPTTLPPTNGPTSSPTIATAPGLSQSPSTVPSSSVEPSGAPSQHNLSPTTLPSQVPSQSRLPSAQPSMTSSATEPTTVPSQVPTLSQFPSAQPSTTGPTSAPIEEMPSTTPSSSSRPSSAPSLSFSPSMSRIPTLTPTTSDMPSTTFVPSQIPSMLPASSTPSSSLSPSSAPSLSLSPSMSRMPTLAPTTSQIPSTTFVPSQMPSTLPASTIPSSSSSPSSAPSLSFSPSMSHMPTQSPTISEIPSMTLVPSEMPSALSPLSLEPSSMPSESSTPSMSPSASPSMMQATSAPVTQTPTMPQPSLPPSIPLVIPVRDCTTADPCERCEGDCDSDAQCMGTLVCFQKGEGEEGEDAVGGCLGDDLSRTDWCTLPEFIGREGELSIPTAMPSTSAMPTLSSAPSEKTRSPTTSLRPTVSPSSLPSSTFVPSIQPSSSKAPTLSVAPSAVTPMPTTSQEPTLSSSPTFATNEIPLVKPVRNCTETDKCERCEGDCDNDDQCVGLLICFQRGKGMRGQQAVPGCIGHDLSRTDWCTNSFFKQNTVGIFDMLFRTDPPPEERNVSTTDS